jgi:hypothetical protein
MTVSFQPFATYVLELSFSFTLYNKESWKSAFKESIDKHNTIYALCIKL